MELVLQVLCNYGRQAWRRPISVASTACSGVLWSLLPLLRAPTPTHLWRADRFFPLQPSPLPWPLAAPPAPALQLSVRYALSVCVQALGPKPSLKLGLFSWAGRCVQGVSGAILAILAGLRKPRPTFAHFAQCGGLRRAKRKKNRNRRLSHLLPNPGQQASRKAERHPPRRRSTRNLHTKLSQDPCTRIADPSHAAATTQHGALFRPPPRGGS